MVVEHEKGVLTPVKDSRWWRWATAEPATIHIGVVNFGSCPQKSYCIVKIMRSWFAQQLLGALERVLGEDDGFP